MRMLKVNLIMSRRAKAFVIADLHFGHKLMETVRPWKTIQEHDEALIDNWNSVVDPIDRVYVLGDLCMNRKSIAIVGKCNGRKVLVKGNHDGFKLKDYTPYFDDIRAYVIKPAHGLIMSHIPIHPASLERWKLNVHGHTHSYSIDDPRYRCVSVEQTDYKPMDLMEILNGI